MKWFDQNYNYVDEFTTQWNNKFKKIRNGGILLSLVLILIGILCIAFPKQVFTTIQVLAALGLVLWGVGSIYTYFTTTFFFRDSLWLATGILNILLGFTLCTMPITFTVSTLTIVLAMLLLVNGISKVSFSSKLRFFQIIDTSLMNLTGWLNILLGIIFVVMPLQSALVINYLVAAYLIFAGICLLIEVVSMKRI